MILSELKRTGTKQIKVTITADNKVRIKMPKKMGLINCKYILNSLSKSEDVKNYGLTLRGKIDGRNNLWLFKDSDRKNCKFLVIIKEELK